MGDDGERTAERPSRLNSRQSFRRNSLAKPQRRDVYAAGLLEDATRRPVAPDGSQASPPAAEVVEAIERLKSFGKSHGLSLGGMTIRELAHEARP